MEKLGKKIPGKRAWKVGDLVDNQAWQVELSDTELDQLIHAANTLPEQRDAWLNFTPEGFGAPRFNSRMKAVADELNRGFGFCKISGLNIEGYDEDMLYRLYWVIAVSLGNVVPQNARGEMVGAVTDLIGGAARGTDDRGYTSSDELRFHCDGGGASSLFCVRQAPVGGENSVVSLLAIYNELLENHPEHLETLYRGFPLYQRKEAGDGQSRGSVSNSSIPTFSENNGQVSAWLNLKLAELASEVSNSPYSGVELDALKCVEAIAERDEFKYSFKLKPGELFVLNNFSLMHKRSAFTDDPDHKNKRLMLRLWFNPHGAATPIPEVAKLRVGFKHAAPVITAV